MVNELSIEDYTRFEKTRIIGARSLQIAMGAPLLVKAKSNELDPIDLATREFVAGVIPMTVKRPLPKKVK